MSNEQILELVGAIYDAAADPSCWPAFLERHADAVGGTQWYPDRADCGRPGVAPPAAYRATLI